VSAETYESFFRRATGHDPFPYQTRLALSPELPQLIDIPTGAGKTAAVVMAWLWRRRFAADEVRKATPRRLVYCLPMRVLVEQTRDNTILWLLRLGLLAGEAKEEGSRIAYYRPRDGHRAVQDDIRPVDGYAIEHGVVGNRIAVTVLMGGEDADEWDMYPERDAIIIGTQDMLLSRALNRGYGACRSRWPMQFGLLNNDCLWVYDEIQLMGAGLATTPQLEVFRRLLGSKAGNGCLSIWMSATMRRDWLATVDFDPKSLDDPISLEAADIGNDELNKRWKAKKPITRAEAAMGDAAALAQEVCGVHKPGTRTIVVLNTVQRACELFKELNLKEKKGRKRQAREKDASASSDPKIVLLHSRFRPDDRKGQVKQSLAEPPPEGTIVVSTQVIEAGVDVSAATLFTELAPWASLVQRFGRCNRRGEYEQEARVFWIDMPKKKTDTNKIALPYELDDFKASGERLKILTDVGLRSLPEVEMPFEHTQVIRRKDMIELFDTTADLVGNDIDIDRFVREIDASDVQVFWRDYGETPNATDDKEAEPAPRREELCRAPIGEFRDFVKKNASSVWRWDFLDKNWEKADTSKITPRQAFLIHADAGGYLAERGWESNSKKRVEPIVPSEGTKGNAPDATEDDRLSYSDNWQTIAEHTDKVCNELNTLLDALPCGDGEAIALRSAARWHDRGKAHAVFQNAIDDGQVIERYSQEIRRRERPIGWRGQRFIAKAPDQRKDIFGKVIDKGFWRRYDWLPYEGRKYFRHELASALTVLLNGQIPREQHDLIAYLVASHHGKVRLSIRSLPNEKHPDGERRFARGVWDGDSLPATELGGGTTAPGVTLSLEPMELGLCEHEPFAGQPSWVERMLRLRDTLGPFHLAYLEAILRAADWRGSRVVDQRKTSDRKVIAVATGSGEAHA